MSLSRPADLVLAQPGQGMAAQHNDRTIPQAEQEDYEYEYAFVVWTKSNWLTNRQL